MKPTLQEILERLRRDKEILKREFAVERIGIFGSLVKGMETEDSDVDFLVEFDISRLTFDKFLALEKYLKEITGREVDILTVGGLRTIRIPHIREDIERSVVYA